MGLFSGLFGGNNGSGSANPYASTRDRDKNTRQRNRDKRDAAARRTAHRRGIPKSAAKGQAWEDRDRQQDRHGTWYKPAR